MNIDAHSKRLLILYIHFSMFLRMQLCAARRRTGIRVVKVLAAVPNFRAELACFSLSLTGFSKLNALFRCSRHAITVLQFTIFICAFFLLLIDRRGAIIIIILTHCRRRTNNVTSIRLQLLNSYSVKSTVHSPCWNVTAIRTTAATANVAYFAIV